MKVISIKKMTVLGVKSIFYRIYKKNRSYFRTYRNVFFFIVFFFVSTLLTAKNKLRRLRFSPKHWEARVQIRSDIGGWVLTAHKGDFRTTWPWGCRQVQILEQCPHDRAASDLAREQLSTRKTATPFLSTPRRSERLDFYTSLLLFGPWFCYKIPQIDRLAVCKLVIFRN